MERRSGGDEEKGKDSISGEAEKEMIDTIAIIKMAHNRKI